MLRGADPAATEVTLSHILAKARDAHMATLLAGMLAAPNYGDDYKRRFDAIYPELAQQFGVTLYPFFLDRRRRRPARSSSRTASTRTAPASSASSKASCPRSRRCWRRRSGRALACAAPSPRAGGDQERGCAIA